MLGCGFPLIRLAPSSLPATVHLLLRGGLMGGSKRLDEEKYNERLAAKAAEARAKLAASLPPRPLSAAQSERSASAKAKAAAQRKASRARSKALDPVKASVDRKRHADGEAARRAALRGDDPAVAALERKRRADAEAARRAALQVSDPEKAVEVKGANSSARAVARGLLDAEEAAEIKGADSSARAVARGLLDAKEAAEIKGADSSARAVARGLLDAEEAAEIKDADSSARAVARGLLDAKEAAEIKGANSSARAVARGLLDAEAAAEIKDANSSARAVARGLLDAKRRAEIKVDNAREHRDARNAQGVYNLAAPADMPTDAVLAEFETNVASAQALFWASSGNYLFEAWRDLDFANMDADSAASLKAAMTQEGLVTDEDIERVMRDYHERMDPTLPPLACGCCGVADVPLPGFPLDSKRFEGLQRQALKDAKADAKALEAKAEKLGIETFHVVQLDDPKLAVLLYTAAQNTSYELPVPAHVADTPLNRARWQRFRPIISALTVIEGFAGLSAYEDRLDSKDGVSRSPISSILAGQGQGGDGESSSSSALASSSGERKAGGARHLAAEAGDIPAAHGQDGSSAFIATAPLSVESEAGGDLLPAAGHGDNPAGHDQGADSKSGVPSSVVPSSAESKAGGAPAPGEDHQDDDNCSICMEVATRGSASQPTSTLPCKHTYHTACIGSWLRSSNNPSCPLCRTQVQVEPVRSVRFHLYRQLCTATSTNLCGTCNKAVNAGKIPTISIAGGRDLGSPELVEPPLPVLSFADKLCIGRSRVLSSALNITELVVPTPTIWGRGGFGGGSPLLYRLSVRPSVRACVCVFS